MIVCCRDRLLNKDWKFFPQHKIYANVSVKALGFEDCLARQFGLEERTASIFRDGVMYQTPGRTGILAREKIRHG